MRQDSQICPHTVRAWTPELISHFANSKQVFRIWDFSNNLPKNLENHITVAMLLVAVALYCYITDIRLKEFIVFFSLSLGHYECSFESSYSCA